MKAMYKFQFVDDNGKITYIIAECRTKAVAIYCDRIGCNEDYVKKHIVVRKTFDQRARKTENKKCDLENKKSHIENKSESFEKKERVSDFNKEIEIEQLKRNLEQCENGYRQQIHLLECKFEDEKKKILKNVFDEIDTIFSKNYQKHNVKEPPFSFSVSEGIASHYKLCDQHARYVINELWEQIMNLKTKHGENRGGEKQ